ncbi:MAG: hypothetical protein WCI57_01660 [Candidatus Berkelbacteria bacterium]
MNEEIYNLLQNGTSVILVGETDSGKSWFVEKQLIPYLESKGQEVQYFSDCNEIPDSADDKKVGIFDEVETFLDREFLEKSHPEDFPYYTPEYEEAVKNWFLKLAKFTKPSVYIITRNSKADIKNFLNNITSVDWDERKIAVISFSKEDRV